jgi:hypothetical protein
MRATVILAIAAATAVTHAASADVKRHEFIPVPLRGSWAPRADDCKNAGKAVIVVSDKTYVSAEANCTVMWVSETAATRGSIYAAHLQCAKPDEKNQNTQSNVILAPKDAKQISIGPSFGNLKDYQRCPAN